MDTQEDPHNAYGRTHARMHVPCRPRFLNQKPDSIGHQKEREEVGRGDGDSH